tara:strand:- start:501 stop:953 length:453 start_codon:yes stop_codon:yes gene_type:complete
MNTTTATQPTKAFHKSRLIEPWIRTFISDNNLVVLRDKATGKPLNVTYSEEGLKWTCNARKKSLYYKDATMKWQKHPTKDMWLPYFEGDLNKSPNVIVEPFVPMDHKYPDGSIKSRYQSFEFLWCNKAMKLLIPMNMDRQERNRLVFSSN